MCVFTSSLWRATDRHVYACALVSLNELWGHRLSFMFTFVNEWIRIAYPHKREYFYWPFLRYTHKHTHIDRWKECGNISVADCRNAYSLTLTHTHSHKHMTILIRIVVIIRIWPHNRFCSFINPPISIGNHNDADIKIAYWNRENGRSHISMGFHTNIGIVIRIRWIYFQLDSTPFFKKGDLMNRSKAIPNFFQLISISSILMSVNNPRLDSIWPSNS